MATGRGYAKGDGKTKKGRLPQQLPMPSTTSTASSSSSEPMQTQQQQVASTPPDSITTGSQNVSLPSTLFLGTNHSGTAPSNWFISTIPEDAPAARPAEPVAVFTDDDLFDEPDWVPPIHVQIPADWPPLPDTSSSSGSSYVYPDGSTTDEGTLPRSFSHNTSSLQGTIPNYTPPSTLSTSHHSSGPATNTDQDTLNHP